MLYRASTFSRSFALARAVIHEAVTNYLKHMMVEANMQAACIIAIAEESKPAVVTGTSRWTGSLTLPAHLMPTPAVSEVRIFLISSHKICASCFL